MPPDPPHIRLSDRVPAPGNQAALQRALTLQRAGRLREAIAGFEAILARTPRLPAVQLQLGLAHKAAGDPESAIAALRRALELDPRRAETHHALAGTLAAAGELQPAAAHALQAVTLAPQAPAFRRGLAGLLPFLRFAESSPGVLAAVERCFRDDGIDHQSLVSAALELLRLDPAIARALARPDDAASAAALRAADFAALFEQSLLRLVLTTAVVADEPFERLFTSLRRAFLEADAAPDGIPDDRLDFAAALACQCDLCGYSHAESAEETAAVASLRERVGRASELTASLVVLALYRPVFRLANTGRLVEAAAPSEALALVQRRLLLEPREEQTLAAAFPALTPIDEDSAAAQRQPEAHPYPRWRSTRARPARPLHQVAARLFPQQAAVDPLPEPVEVLVAGCGTGKHAIDAATRYSGSRVLAIDLSRASLAYGERQARARGIGNLRFAQADILALDALAQHFDLVECAGVLHRLADPLAGWGLLVDHLKPGGFLRLGLPSAQGRRHISAARRFVGERGFEATDAGIRAARQAILALAQDHPARRLAGELDFYNLQACRDLLFNTQEPAFTLPRIESAIADLGLAFIGFEFSTPAIPQAYARRFPQDKAMTDLALWHRFEQEAPSTFGRKYLFWCRRA